MSWMHTDILNDDFWRGDQFETKEDAIEDALGEYPPGTPFQVGELDYFDPLNGDWGEFIVDELMRRAVEDGHAEDSIEWPNVTRDQIAALDQLITPVIDEWLKECGQVPCTFGEINHVSDHAVPFETDTPKEPAHD